MKNIRFMNCSQMNKFYKNHKSFTDRIFLKYGFSQEHYLGYVPLFFLPILKSDKYAVKNIHYHLNQSMRQQRNIYENKWLRRAARSSSVVPNNDFSKKIITDNYVTVQNPGSIFNSNFYQRVSRGYSSLVRIKVMQDTKGLPGFNNTTLRSGVYPRVSIKSQNDYQFTESRLYSLQLPPGNNIRNQANTLARYGKCSQIIEHSHMLFKSRQSKYFFNSPMVPGLSYTNADVSLFKTINRSYLKQGISLREHILQLTDNQNAYIKLASSSSYKLAPIMYDPGSLPPVGDKHGPEYYAWSAELDFSSQLQNIRQLLSMSHWVSHVTNVAKSGAKPTGYRRGQLRLPKAVIFNGNISNSESFGSNWYHWGSVKQQYSQTYSRPGDPSIAYNLGKFMVMGQWPLFVNIDNVYVKNAYLPVKQLANVITILRKPLSNTNSIKSLKHQTSFLEQTSQQLRKYESINRGLPAVDRKYSINKAVQRLFLSKNKFDLNNSRLAGNRTTQMLAVSNPMLTVGNQSLLIKEAFQYSNSLLIEFNAYIRNMKKYWLSHFYGKKTISKKPISRAYFQESFNNEKLYYKLLFAEEPAIAAQAVSFMNLFNRFESSHHFTNQTSLKITGYYLSRTRKGISQKDQSQLFTRWQKLYADRFSLSGGQTRFISMIGRPSRIAVSQSGQSAYAFESPGIPGRRIIRNNEKSRYLNLGLNYSYFKKAITNFTEMQYSRQWISSLLKSEKNVYAMRYQLSGWYFNYWLLDQDHFYSDSSVLQSFDTLEHHKKFSPKGPGSLFTSNGKVDLKSLLSAEILMDKAISAIGSYLPGMAGNQQAIRPLIYRDLLYRNVTINNGVKRYREILSANPGLKKNLANTTGEKHSSYYELYNLWLSKPVNAAKYLSFTGHFNSLVMNPRYFISGRSIRPRINIHEYYQESSLAGLLQFFTHTHRKQVRNSQPIGRQVAVITNISARGGQGNNDRVSQSGTFTYKRNRLNIESYQHVSDNNLELNQKNFYPKTETTRQLYPRSKSGRMGSRVSIGWPESVRKVLLQQLYNQPGQNQTALRNKFSVYEFSAYSSFSNNLELIQKRFKQKNEATRQFYLRSKNNRLGSRVSIGWPESVRNLFLQRLYNQPGQNQAALESRFNVYELSAYSIFSNNLELIQKRFKQKNETTRQIYPRSQSDRLGRDLSIGWPESVWKAFLPRLYNQPDQNQATSGKRFNVYESSAYSNISNNLELIQKRFKQKNETTRQIYLWNKSGRLDSGVSIGWPESVRNLFLQRLYSQTGQNQAAWGNRFNVYEFSAHSSIFNNLELKQKRSYPQTEVTRKIHPRSTTDRMGSRMPELGLSASVQEKSLPRLYNRPGQNKTSSENRFNVYKFSSYSSVFNNLELNQKRFSQKTKRTVQSYQQSKIVLPSSPVAKISLPQSTRVLYAPRIQNRQIQMQYRKAEPISYNTSPTILTNHEHTFYKKTASADGFREQHFRPGYETSAHAVYKEQLENHLSGIILEFKRENRGKSEISANDTANSQTITSQSDPGKVAARLSNEQLDKIAASLYQKFEKKLKFERQRSGIR